MWNFINCALYREPCPFWHCSAYIWKGCVFFSKIDLKWDTFFQYGEILCQSAFCNFPLILTYRTVHICVRNSCQNPPKAIRACTPFSCKRGESQGFEYFCWAAKMFRLNGICQQSHGGETPSAEGQEAPCSQSGATCFLPPVSLGQSLSWVPLLQDLIVLVGKTQWGPEDSFQAHAGSRPHFVARLPLEPPSASTWPPPWGGLIMTGSSGSIL